MNSRRTFLKKLGITSAALLLAEKIYADPYQPLLINSRNPQSRVQVKGRISSAGKGVKGVAVSDGLSVAVSSSDGCYTLISNPEQQFIFISLPAGYTIPTNQTGTARFYNLIDNSKEEQVINFELTKDDLADDEHTFLVLADPQTINMEDIGYLNSQTVPDVKKFVSGISTPAFGVACGDIMFDNLELFPEYEKAVKQMELPFFQVFGNHDAETLAKTDEASIRTYQQHFGPSYYSFNKGEIHYVVLDDVFWFGDYIGYISQPQLTWLENDLSLIEKGKTVIVFAHIPWYSEFYKRVNETSPPSNLVVTNRELLYRILEPYKSYLICGHTHESEFINDGSNEIHVGGAVCGAWWTGPICVDGTPNGYSIYSVKGTDVRWKYKSTGKDISYQMRVYKQGNNILANVWNANKDWKISLYSSGDKTAMKQIQTLDPLATELYAGQQKPGRYDWVDPVPANHIFSADLLKDSKDVTIEAVNKWGEIFTGKL